MRELTAIYAAKGPPELQGGDMDGHVISVIAPHGELVRLLVRLPEKLSTIAFNEGAEASEPTIFSGAAGFRAWLSTGAHIHYALIMASGEIRNIRVRVEAEAA